MTQEEREAANAALALDELIEKRVWEIIQTRPWLLDKLMIDAIRRNAWDVEGELKGVRTHEETMTATKYTNHASSL